MVGCMLVRRVLLRRERRKGLLLLRLLLRRCWWWRRLLRLMMKLLLLLSGWSRLISLLRGRRFGQKRGDVHGSVEVLVLATGAVFLAMAGQKGDGSHTESL